MKLLPSLKELKIGQKVAWKYIDNMQIDLEKPVGAWMAVGQVKGFKKKTTYPQRDNGLVYETKEVVVFDTLHVNKSATFIFLLRANDKNEINSFYDYDRAFFDVYLLEDEKDYIEVVKHLIIESF